MEVHAFEKEVAAQARHYEVEGGRDGRIPPSK
jgi:hypothetical protein